MEKKYWLAVACRILLLISSFVATIFINRGLGVTAKGEYAYVVYLVEILYLFCSFGIGQSYATFKKRYGICVKKLFINLAFFQTMIIICLGLFVCFFVDFDYEYTIVFLVGIATLKVILSMVAVVENSIERNIILVVTNFLYISILFCLFLKSLLTVSAALICYAVNDILFVIFFLFRQEKNDNRVKDTNIIKQIYKVGFQTMAMMVLISANYSIDILMIKMKSTTYELGLYSVAVNFFNMFLLIPDSFKEVLFEDTTSKNFEKKRVTKIVRISYTICSMIFVGFVCFGKFAIDLFYGSEYIDAYLLTIILFLGGYFLLLFKIMQPVYITYGLQCKAIVYLTISVIVNVAMNLYLIPLYSSMGAAIASVVSYGVCGILFWYKFKSKGGII